MRDSIDDSRGVNLRYLTGRFWKKMIPTWGLVIAEGGLVLLFPLVIGWSVDGLRNDSLTGVIQLGALCLFMLLIGGGRRFYDTRAYADIHCRIGGELVHRETERSTPVSAMNARAGLFQESSSSRTRFLKLSRS